ncbi:LruC domain-containing protein [Sphingobacterium sp. KU25419]|nr:LruC domain-containing protein [Sphingobacterium sp. KU25419]
MAITYSGNLEIACSDHTVNGQWNTYYVINSPAKLVAYDKSTVVIAGTSCNAGGNNAPGGNPTDQTVTEVNLGTYSYAFEDNWPNKGDYDMNDFVVDMNITKLQNATNKVTKVVLKGKLRSVGASKRLAAAVQLDGVTAGNVKSVTYSKKDLVGANLKLSANGTETGQTNAVVAIVDDAHKAFGVSDTRFISTQNGAYSPVVW